MAVQGRGWEWWGSRRYGHVWLAGGKLAASKGCVFEKSVEGKGDMHPVKACTPFYPGIPPVW